MDGPPHVFLIPKALQPDCGDLRRMFGNQFIERLSLPEGVVIWMLHHLDCPGKLFQAVETSVITGGACAPEGFVIVVSVTLNRVAGVVLGGLAESVIEVRLATRPVVKRVI